MSSVDFKIEKDLCRCCHSQGIYKSLSDPCPRSKEAFSDMLRFCFEINLTPIPGLRCITTYKICSACIKRLQDAVEFKNSVLACEDLFRDMYAKSVKEEDSDVMVIKEESSGEDVAIILDDSDVLSVKDEEDPSSLNNVTTVAVELAGSEAEVKTEDEDGGITDDDFRIDDATSGTDEDFKKQLKEYQRKATSRRRAKTVKEQANMSKKRKKDKPTGRKEKGGAEPQKEKKSATKGTSVKESNVGVGFFDSYYTFLENTERYACNGCFRNFGTPATVVQHYRQVHLRLRSKMRSCHLCDIQVFAHAKAYHLETEHGIPAPSCGACGKKFSYPFQVLRHEKTYHMGNKKFTCQTCNMSFTSQLILKEHLVEHSEDREFKCDYCENTYMWKHSLKKHIMMMHLSDKSHVCIICNEAFVQPHRLKSHMKWEHPGIL